MQISKIFDVFSRRNAATPALRDSVSDTLRKKILLLCNDVFRGRHDPWRHEDHLNEFWKQIHDMLLYRHGRFRLSQSPASYSLIEDAVEFLLNCPDREFLDFVEYIFRVDCLFHVSTDENEIVSDINCLLQSENAPFELTNMIKQEVIEPIEGMHFPGGRGRVIKTIAYPQIIHKDDTVLHEEVIRPALQLLEDPHFSTANTEFLEALEDYRKKDYGDCLTKCCSAFESVMKIICAERKWIYNEKATAATLLKTILDNSNIPAYFEQPLIVIATLRNRQSKAHGSGLKARNVTENVAKFSVNATASAVLFLVNETKK